MMALLSSATLADDQAAADWLTLIRVSSARGLGPAMQYEATIAPDRTRALQQVGRPCLVIAFAEDKITPPAMCQEVASAIPGCQYVEIDQCGHFGFLERPDEVNATLLGFFASAGWQPGRERSAELCA
jgi:pimeloyl-ACP methyl ester carboxylesterase